MRVKDYGNRLTIADPVTMGKRTTNEHEVFIPYKYRASTPLFLDEATGEFHRYDLTCHEACRDLSKLTTPTVSRNQK